MLHMQTAFSTWHPHGIPTTARSCAPHVRVRCVCAVHIPAAHTQAADLATAIASADGKVTAAAVNNMLARERDCMSKGTTKPQGTQPALPGKARGAAIR